MLQHLLWPRRRPASPARRRGGGSARSLDPGALRTLAFVTLVFGNQAVMYALRERRSLWSSLPSAWVLASSAADIGIVATLSLSGTLMQPLPVHIVAASFVASVGFALVLDRIKRPVEAAFNVT
jgi:H+-transporting ATPase